MSACLLLAMLAGGIPASAALADFKAGVEAYQRGDYETAIHEWLPYAAENDPKALFNLGQMYRLGQGTPIDRLKAEQYYRRAAALGHIGALANLGSLYYEADPPQGGEAAYFWRRAARGGEPRSQYYIGVQYLTGEYISRDYVLAYAWLSLSAKAGFAPASERLVEAASQLNAAQIQEATRLAGSLVVTPKVAESPDPSKPRDVAKPDILALGQVRENPPPARPMSELLEDKLFAVPPAEVRGAVPVPDMGAASSSDGATDRSRAAVAPEPRAVSDAPRPEAPAPPASPVEKAPAPAAAKREEPSPAPSAPPSDAAEDGSVYRAQFASMVGEGEAETLKTALETGHADLLKGVELKVDPMRVGAEGLLVRLRSGAVGDRRAAEAVCARFRARQVECQVVKSLSIDVTRRDEADPTRQAASARTPARRAVPVSVAVKPSAPRAATEAIPVKRDTHMLAVDAGEADRWRVQVGAGRSEDEARQRWSALLGSHGDLLEALELFVYRADLGQKGVYYRVQLGRFGKRESAATLCGHLKERQVDCFVTASPN
jgi:hypothetical protein